MPYILSTMLVLTPLLRGLRFMPRRYTQTDKARVEEVSAKLAKLHLFWRVAESAYMCHDFRVQLETLQTESWVLEVSLYYNTSFVQLHVLLVLKATKGY